MGAVHFVILGLLLSGPLSLYDVHKRFTAGISLFYSASFGSIQRALARLEADAYATVTNSPDSRRRKKLYASTPAGEAAWRQWMLAPIEGSAPETDVLAKVFLLGRLTNPVDRRQAIEVMGLRIRADLQGLRDLASSLDSAAVPGAHEVEFLFQRATLEYGIRSTELALDWLREVEEMTNDER